MQSSGSSRSPVARWFAVVFPLHFLVSLLVRVLRAPDGQPLARTLALPVLLGGLVGSALFAAVLALFLGWLARRRREGR